MPSIAKALEEAILKGAKGAKVVRPAEKELLKREAEQAAREAAEAAAKESRETAEAAAKDPLAPAKEAVPAAPAPVSEPDPGITKAVPEKTVPQVKAKESVAPAEVEAPLVDVVPPEPIPVAETATRLSKANLGDYALDESYMPNFDQIQLLDEGKAVIADLAESNKLKIDEARRGVITDQQLKGLAADLNTSEAMVRRVMERETGGILNAETILGARQFVNASAERLKTLADKISANNATPLEKVQFARQVQFHNDFFAQFMGARAEAGRAVRAFGVPTGLDDAGSSRISELISLAGGDVERLAKAISMTDSVSGVSEIAKGGLFRRSARAMMGLTNRVFVNGILSGPTTHLVNTTGNALYQAMNTAEMALAARLGKFLPGEEHVQVGEALATLHGTLGATRDALRLMARTAKTGQSLDGILKYETRGDAVLYNLPELDKPFLGRFIRGVDNVIDAPTHRVLAAEDELFKTLAYRAYVERQAMLHVQEQFASGALKLEDAAAATKEFMENTPKETASAAEAWAGDMTFQTPLGPTGQKFQSAIRSVPALTLIAPFIRTPVNIFKQSAARSPVAMFTPRFWNDVRAGGRARDLALTKFAVGSGTAAVIANMAMDGEVTGAGPQDPAAKAIWESDGRRPYSVKVRNNDGSYTWHSYARMEPVASVVGATADTAEILSQINSDAEPLKDEERQAYDAASAIIVGIMNNTGNKTFMKGITDFVNFVDSPSKEIRGYSNQMATSVGLPYSAALRAVRNTQDPYLREAWTALDKLRDTVPGYSKDLPMALDFFGEPRMKRASSMLGTMSPIPESPENYNFVEKELINVMKNSGKVPVTMPEKDIEGMKLNAEEYHNYVRLARGMPIFDGKTFYQKLEEVVSTPEYQDLSFTMRAEMLRKYQSAADREGRSLLEQDNPNYALRIADWRIKKERLKFEQ